MSKPVNLKDELTNIQEHYLATYPEDEKLFDRVLATPLCSDLWLRVIIIHPETKEIMRLHDDRDDSYFLPTGVSQGKDFSTATREIMADYCSQKDIAIAYATAVFRIDTGWTGSSHSLMVHVAVVLPASSMSIFDHPNIDWCNPNVTGDSRLIELTEETALEAARMLGPTNMMVTLPRVSEHVDPDFTPLGKAPCLYCEDLCWIAPEAKTILAVGAKIICEFCAAANCGPDNYAGHVDDLGEVRWGDSE